MDTAEIEECLYLEAFYNIPNYIDAGQLEKLYNLRYFIDASQLQSNKFAKCILHFICIFRYLLGFGYFHWFYFI